MDGRRTPFVYSLAALLRRDQWEGDILAQEAGRARQVVEARRHVHAETLDRIAQAQAEMRALYRPDARLSLERRQILDTFLRHQEELAQQQETAVAQAERLLEQITAQWKAKRLSAKTMERHRDRLERERTLEEVRRETKADDELWLARRQREER